MSEKLELLVRKTRDDAVVPRYAHTGDAGLDLAISEDLSLAPGQRAVVGTGIAVAIPGGYAGFVYPRSGLAAREGLSMVNSPGVIDSGYRGEIRICLLNTDTATTIHLAKGDFVAQMVIGPIGSPEVSVVSALPESDRGTGGYGSSGGVASWQGSGAGH